MNPEMINMILKWRPEMPAMSQEGIAEFDAALKEALGEAVQAADALHPATISPWLLHNKDGSHIKMEAFGSARGRLMTKALKNGLAERFNFHDIKAKGQTDDEEGWSGHKSARMREIYERKARLKRATR